MNSMPPTKRRNTQVQIQNTPLALSFHRQTGTTLLDRQHAPRVPARKTSQWFNRAGLSAMTRLTTWSAGLCWVSKVARRPLWYVKFLLYFKPWAVHLKPDFFFSPTLRFRILSRWFRTQRRPNVEALSNGHLTTYLTEQVLPSRNYLCRSRKSRQVPLMPGKGSHRSISSISLMSLTLEKGISLKTMTFGVDW